MRECYEKGIFWCKHSNTSSLELIIVSTECDENGVSFEPTAYSSKSGENFNHKAEWASLPKRVTEGHPFNYYPRGRVEIKNGKAVIFLNPDICTEQILTKVTDAFELRTSDKLRSIQVKSDGSKHYQHANSND